MSRPPAANDSRRQPPETRRADAYSNSQKWNEINTNANVGLDEDDEHDEYMASSIVADPSEEPPKKNPEPEKKPEPKKAKPKKPEPKKPEPKKIEPLPEPKKPEPIVVPPPEPKPVEPEPAQTKEPEQESPVEQIPNEAVEPIEPDETELNPEPVDETQPDDDAEPFALKQVKEEVFIQEAKKDDRKGIIVEPIRPVPFEQPKGEGKAAMFVGDLAKIRPQFTLVFQVDSLVNRYTYEMEIQSTCDQTLIYCIKTTEKKGYRVKPHIGVLQPKESVTVNITLLPHNQYNIDTNRFLVMCMVSHSTKKQLKDPTKLVAIWNKLYANKDKNADEYMEHELHCAINVSDFLANEHEDYMKDKELEALRQGHKPTPAQFMGPLRPPPGYKPTLRALLKGLPLVRNLTKNNAEEGEPPTERDLIMKLNTTHEILRQHIRCFKCFQVFIVVAICGICVILVMAVSFRTMEPVVPVEKESLYEN